jgi:SPP1 gp7 family putative phage head morphogenesis protein
MPHLNVIEHIQPWPHVARMRKRQGRRLKPIRPDHSAELWYRSRLSDLVHHTIMVCKAELPGMLRGSWPTVMDAEPVDRAMRDLKAKHLAGLDQLAKKWSSLAVQKALSGVDTRLANELRRSLGVNVAGILTQEGRIAGEVKKFLVWNTELITSIPEELLGKVGAAVNQAFTSGQRAESLSSLIDDIGEGESGEARARLIARDQLNKMNAGFNRVRQDDLGIESYIWWTSQDERTRTEHRALHGRTFRWDEPGPLAGTIDGEPCHPGEDCNCRCDAIPVVNIDALEAQAASYEETN